MKSSRTALLFAAIFFAPLWASKINMAQDIPPQQTAAEGDAVGSSVQSDHEQLRQLRETLTEAVLKGDIETQLQYVHDDVVTTWQNNRVARGHEGLKKFMEEMNAGNQKVFQGYTECPVSDDVSILYGGTTAIAFGKSVPHYHYLGMEFDLENRWTATLVKIDNQWKIAAYHVSADMTDNPILNAAKNAITWAAIVSTLIGLLIGVVGTKLLSKKNQLTT